MKTFKLYTLGCKANQYDAQRLREALLNSGLHEINNGCPADTYLINTCTVTHKADSDSLQLIRKACRQNPKAKIIVAGCLTELNSNKIKSIDRKIIVMKNKNKEKFAKAGISAFVGRTRAFLKVQDGCDNFCAYCKVPLVRGRSRSRKPTEIIPEAKRLAESGFKEIVLTGICLGAYGRDLKPKSSLAKIIQELLKIKELGRIRLSSIEAGDVSDELIKLMAGAKKICRHLHIPIQSGDDKILRQMNRSCTHAGYAALIKKIKSAVSGIAITTDCLVGFPGETRKNFLNTVKLVKQIRPLKTHIFPYSPREGTKAFGFRNSLSPQEMKARLDILRKAGAECAQKFQKRFLGKQMDVLVESQDKLGPGFWQGHTDNYLKVLVKSDKKLHNRMIRVKLSDLSIDNYFFADYNNL